MAQRSGEKWILAIALGVVLLTYSVAVGAHLVPRRSIDNLDFWYHISVGQQLQWNEPRTLVDGMYPLGYPLLLRLAVHNGIDALRAGQFLSWSGGFLAIASLFLLVYSLTGRVFVAGAGSLLLLTNQQFLYHATYEGNDLLAAGLQAVALTALWRATADNASTRPKVWLAISGGLLGFAYLTRYTALILLPVALCCLVPGHSRSRKGLVGAIAIYLAAFLATTAVQWWPSLIVYRDPFFNTQAKNVWFGMYGQSDWVNNWGKVPDSIRLTQVIALNPGRFILHWYTQVRSALVTTMQWTWLFQIGWILALPLLLLTRQLSLGRRLLLILAGTAPLAITAMAWLSPRFLLLPLWIEAVLITWMAFHLVQLIPLPKRAQLASAGGLLLILIAGLQWQSVNEWLRSKPGNDPLAVNSFLRLAGMQEPERVATNDPYLHASDETLRTRYTQTYWVDPSPSTVDDLLGKPAAKDWEYLVMDYSRGFGNYEEIREALGQAKDRLAPLALTERRDIFCVYPCAFPEAQPIDLDFGPGMHLVGYQLHGTSNEGALYLYWRANTKLTSSFKVSMRVTDSSGKIFYQTDNVPELWTWPTTEWRPQELVVDFYQWHLEQKCSSCGLSILVYDETNLEPVIATSSTGEQVGPLIALQSLAE